MSPFWHLLTYGASESNNVNEDSSNICRVTPPIYTECVKIRAGLACIIEFLDAQIALPDNIVVSGHDAGNRAKENAIR